MKNNIKYIALVFVVVVIFCGCVNEEPQETSASFTTNIENGTLNTGEGFTLYLTDAKGEFLTYYKGDTEETTYGIGTKGAALEDPETDSLSISGYPQAGDYTFTLVAISYGNWSEDMAKDEQSITINVVD